MPMGCRYLTLTSISSYYTEKANSSVGVENAVNFSGAILHYTS